MTVVCTKCGALSIAQCTCSVITHNQYVYGGAIQMTDISNLKPGAALTYEQAMALPDGAVVSAAWGDDLDRNCYTVGSNDAFGVPKKFGGATLEYKEYWVDHRWHSVRLESLPELPVWVITCDRCGTTYKNNERHACAPKKYTQSDLLRVVTMEKHGAEIEQMPDYTPPQPELDSDYRWVNIGERIIGTDEYLTGYGEWVQTGGLEFKCTVAKKYRRRIEPQADPAKPERQASEIEKRAAVALLENCKSSIVERVDSGFNASLRISCEWYIEAYDYAKSIGAIE